MLVKEQTTLCSNCEQNIETSIFFLHERMCSFNVKKCPKCNKAFNLDDLNDHIKLEHSYIICDLCNNKYANFEIEKHKKNCLYQLIPCKYCQLNVLLKEIEEHEELCGSTTKQCQKCGIYIEKKYYENHLCLNKETEFFNENIKIDYEKDVKKEKKRIKYGLEKNSFKKNRIEINISESNKNKENNLKINKNEILENDKYNSFQNKMKKTKKNKIKNNEYNNNINYDMNSETIFSEKEFQSQINILNKFDKNNNIKNLNKDISNKQNKKKKKKNRRKEDKGEENENKTQIKDKKYKKKIVLGGGKSKINKEEDDDDDKLFEEDEYYAGKKNLNLHNIKCDIPPDKFKNYNNINLNYGFEYNLEEALIEEAIKLSLKEQ